MVNYHVMKLKYNIYSAFAGGFAHITFGVLCACAVAGCGCDRADPADSGEPAAANAPAEPAAKKKTSSTEFSPIAKRFKPEDVLFTVNGAPVTRADYDLRSNLRGKTYRYMKRLPLNGPSKEAERFQKNSAMAVVEELIRCRLVEAAAAAAGVAARPETLEAKKKEVLAGIGRPKDTFDTIVKRFGGKYGKALEDSVAYDALESDYLEVFSTNSLTVVTKEEIEAQKAANVEFNAEIARLNAASREKALAAKAEILEKGRLFKDVAKERAELFPEQGEFWDVLEVDELEASDPFARWLAGSDVGDISEPLDFEDGLGIVGVVSKTRSDSSVHPGEEADMYELVRILFKAYVPRDMLDTDEEWTQAILDFRRSEAMKALGKELLGKADLQFPNGNDIFDRKPPRKAKKPAAKKPAEKKPADGKPEKEPAKAPANGPGNGSAEGSGGKAGESV